MVQPVLSVGKGCSAPATLGVLYRSLKLLWQHGKRIHSVATTQMYSKPGTEKAICTAYLFLCTYRAWKALRSGPSNTFLSRRLLSGIQVAAGFCSPAPGKAPHCLRVFRFSSSCPVPMGVPCSWPFRILVFLQ